MPTNRTRRTRTPTLPPEALAWVRTPDARVFFEAKTDTDYTSGEILSLPGVFPWWDLLDAWLAREDVGTARDELAFVMALHAAYKIYRTRS